MARETAWTLVGRSVPALEARDGGCWVVLMPFLKPRMPQTRTVPGFRLGPDLPRVNPYTNAFCYFSDWHLQDIVSLWGLRARINHLCCLYCLLTRIAYTIALQILALTLLHIHTLPGGPLPLLSSRAHAGVVLPHPPRTLAHPDTHSLLRDCDGRLLSLSLSLWKLQKLCVGRWGPVSLWCVCWVQL